MKSFVPNALSTNMSLFSYSSTIMFRDHTFDAVYITFV